LKPDEFRDCLQAIGWTQRGLADLLGVHETRVRRWATGRIEIPGNVAAWLGELAQAHVAASLPEGWVRRSDAGADAA